MSASPTSVQAKTQSKAQTVNSFSLRLEGFQQVLRAEQPIEQIETLILAQLENPVRLLRWALVKIETATEAQQDVGQGFWCEGAYLKSCQ